MTGAYRVTSRVKLVNWLMSAPSAARRAAGHDLSAHCPRSPQRSRAQHAGDARRGGRTALASRALWRARLGPQCARGRPVHTRAICQQSDRATQLRLLTLTRGRRSEVVPVAEVVDPTEAGSILKRYTERVPITRSYFVSPHGALVEAFAEVAGRHPVFRILDGNSHLAEPGQAEQRPAGRAAERTTEPTKHEGPGRLNQAPYGAISTSRTWGSSPDELLGRPAQSSATRMATSARSPQQEDRVQAERGPEHGGVRHQSGGTRTPTIPRPAATRHRPRQARAGRRRPRPGPCRARAGPGPRLSHLSSPPAQPGGICHAPRCRS
jgi:hypothetical protein